MSLPGGPFQWGIGQPNEPGVLGTAPNVDHTLNTTEGHYLIAVPGLDGEWNTCLERLIIVTRFTMRNVFQM